MSPSSRTNSRSPGIRPAARLAEDRRRPTDAPSSPHAREAEEAGGREPFEDAALYDWEYRRRRADVNFYRRLVIERLGCAAPGPVLDLACGSGRLLVPLLRDGHTVVGLDRSLAMLTRAAERVARLSQVRRRRALLVRGDLRTVAFAPRFALAICAFHSVQHLVSDADLLAFFRRARRSLRPDGWLAFDTLPPDPNWIARDPNRRWGRTVFRHPRTGTRIVYTTNHRYDEHRKALHMRLYYQPLDERGEPRGRETIVRLCHRQLAARETELLLERAGFAVMGAFGGFDARPLNEGDATASSDSCDQHIFVARSRVRKPFSVGK